MYTQQVYFYAHIRTKKECVQNFLNNVTYNLRSFTVKTNIIDIN